jgi:GH15 family glucan-1,4-alpha-glucosidase
MQAPRLIPYPPLAALGVIGDRRTAALVAADGNLSWLCLPDFDGAIVCGALLDNEKGGFWQLGPVERRMGRQTYLEDTALLVTTWELEEGQLELTDFMPGPEKDRSEPPPDQRVIVRRLRCLTGQVPCCWHFEPACNFEPAFLQIESPALAHVPAPASLLGKVAATISQAFTAHSGAQPLPLW